MPIIIPPPSPVPPSLQQKSGAYKARMNSQYYEMTKLFSEVAVFVWGNPNPQAVFDAFGTNAGDLFKLAAAFTALVATYTGTPPASPVPPQYAYVINPDGTVTVSLAS